MTFRNAQVCGFKDAHKKEKPVGISPHSPAVSPQALVVAHQGSEYNDTMMQ